MAKEVSGLIKLQIKGGAANPAPPVGPALGSKGVNIMEFCKQFRLLDLVLQYDTMCREALAKGADMNALFNIKAREAIGRAKTEDPDRYAEAYDKILAEMRAEIAEAAQGGEEQ